MAVSVDPGDTPDVLRSYQQTSEYPWLVTPGNREIVERYNVMTTMSKYVVDRAGTIASKGGHMAEDARVWERRFDELARP